MNTLREAAQQALEAMGSVGADWVCEASRHAKKDQHKGGEPCPLQQRWHVAYQALRAALAEPVDETTLDVSGATCFSATPAKWPVKEESR